MKRAFLPWFVSLVVTSLSAQVNTQVVVVGLLKTDRTFHRREELFLETQATRDQVVYAYDSSSKHFAVKEYVSESGYSIWDGERTVKEKHKTRTPRFSNRIPEDRLQQFLVDLATNVDSLPVSDYFLHTSHYYLNVFVSIVADGDTTTWHKSQPFERTTPWHSEKGTFLNPAIDAFVAALLPKKFVGREVVANPRVAEKDPTSMLRSAFRVRNISTRPGSLSVCCSMRVDEEAVTH